MFEISIIILTFNSKNFIKPCLESIFEQEYKNFEVIVVDNGSKDTTPEFIRKNYPEVILIENKDNLGACAARNQAISISSGEWILTLDCDVVLEKDFLSNFFKLIKDLPDTVGMVQPKILMLDKKTLYSAGIYLTKIFRRFYDIGKGRFDSHKFNYPKYIFGACSACAFYKREMLEDLKEDTGYFDERFFFLVEDVDLSWRAQRKGWKTLSFPETVCYHYGNSSGTSKKLRQCLCFRNRYYAIIKNEGIRKYFIKIFPLLFYDFPRLFYLLVTNWYIYKSIF